MRHAPLERANRALLRAIETPPDTGREDRLDDLAARTWFLARERPREADPGRLSRLEYALGRLADESDEPRARRLREARDCLRESRRRLDPLP